jgi:hypothetical protein
MFGGLNHQNYATNDIYILKFRKNKHDEMHSWVKPQTFGKPPTPRYMHSLDYFKDSNVIIVYGGRND